ncbi:hypothetical protein [Tenacibaculum haliotis]|uniref:hypothetical protein n=1 Tax=Tenacibaculum haliotis TaxID=1888914 RepID=UPI0021AF6B22|nr:hypothetical protein [Tenacibaculum haliotis]MCT4698480.1 hypothetical protein [Tenacibaculum haliotis]
MAYNKKNFYKKVIKVQNLVLDKKRENEDLFLKEIYWGFIYQQYDICYRTYCSYLGVNAKSELKKLLEKEQLLKEQLNKQQYNLF